MNIVVAGCSWSAGCPEQPFSWVEALAEIMPKHNFYNYAYAGNSLLTSLHLLDIAKEQVDVDKVIFQLTTPTRLSFALDTDKLNANHYQITDNYYSIPKELEMVALTPGAVFDNMSSDNEFIKFGKMYYKYFSNDYYTDITSKALIDLIQTQSHIQFFHTRPKYNYPFPIIEDMLNFDDYVIDNGKHFNVEGAKKEAKIVEKWLENY
jgi:hypothetical protein